MDAMEALLTTRAIRRFRPDDVALDDIETCLQAAQQAPSGGNVQPQQYLVVRDTATRVAIGELYRSAFDRYERTLPSGTAFRDEADGASWDRTKAASRHLADHLGDVPVLVVFLQPILPWAPSDEEGPMDIGRLDASVYPAVQNFCVAARALGLGTTVTTVIRIHTAEVLGLLGVPEGRFEIAALVPVGHPVGSFGVARRRPAASVTHWNRWKGER